MPPLPDGIGSRHAHVIDVIHQLGESGEKVYVGDVSTRLETTAPSITRLIGELEALGYVVKKGEARDKRFVSLRLSEKGRKFHAVHIDGFHRTLADALSGLSDRDCRATINVVRTFLDTLREAAGVAAKREA